MSMFDTSCPPPRPRPTSQLRPLAAGAALVLACSGCAIVPPPPIAPAPAPVPAPAPAIVTTVYVPSVEPGDRAARQLLAWQDRIMRLQPAELFQEINRLSDPAAAASGGPQASMELALVLTQNHGNGELARAQGLLDQVLRNPGAAEWHGLARLLAARLSDQRRAEEQTERLAQQLRETQRDSQRRIEQLNDKLEALKAIERSMNSRSGPASGATPTKRSP